MNVDRRRYLQAARDLLEVALADASLDALDLALRIEHPTLDERAKIADPVTLRRARTVSRFAGALRGALDEYRQAVYAAFATPPSH